MKNRMKKWFFLLAIAVFAISCESDKKETEATNESETQAVVETEKETKPLEVVSETKSFKNDDIIYTWVDNLNIRAESNTKGKVVTKVSDKQPLIFTGERSDKEETIVLRGVAYHEPWMKIKVDENEGWVFGGAVRRKNEEKGNAEMTDKKFNFEKFGQYNLSTWKLVSTENTGGEELDSETKTYQKNGQILTIEASDMGEFYYGYNYTLKDNNEKVLKERSFSFAVNASDDKHLLTETVKDYTDSTPKEYERTQAIDKHYYQLNAKPMMVRGEWTTK